MNASIRLNRIRISMAILAVATVLLGSLNHFIYEWSGENVVAGLLFATNESVWEHIKLALLPMLLFATVGGLFLNNKVNNYFLAVFCAILVMISTIIIGFYGYTFFARKAILPIDILIFITAIGLGYAAAYCIFFTKKIRWLNVLSAIGIIALWIAFLVLTYRAPKFFVFEELFTEYSPKY